MENSFIQKKYSKQKQGKWGQTGIDDGGGSFIINELRQIELQKRGSVLHRSTYV